MIISEDTTLTNVLSSFLSSQLLNEDRQVSRYSIEVNYRTTAKEVKKSFAILVLGYVMASMKRNNFFVKHVYETDVPRIIVTEKGWEDGRFVVSLYFCLVSNKFIFAEGIYRKRLYQKNASYQPEKVTEIKTEPTNHTSASALSEEMLNRLHRIKGQNLDKIPLNPIKRKTGPQK